MSAHRAGAVCILSTSTCLHVSMSLTVWPMAHDELNHARLQAIQPDIWAMWVVACIIAPQFLPGS